jgi:hypothetical protein
VAPAGELSVEDVQTRLEQHLAWRGNERLKVGSVEQSDESTIVAEIVTADGSLVERFNIDRETGRWQRN